MIESKSSTLKALIANLAFTVLVMTLVYHVIMTLVESKFERQRYDKEIVSKADVQRRLFLIEEVVRDNGIYVIGTDRINGWDLRFTATRDQCIIPSQWKNGAYVYVDVYETRTARYHYRIFEPFSTICRRPENS